MLRKDARGNEIRQLGRSATTEDDEENQRPVTPQKPAESPLHPAIKLLLGKEIAKTIGGGSAAAAATPAAGLGYYGPGYAASGPGMGVASAANGGTILADGSIAGGTPATTTALGGIPGANILGPAAIAHGGYGIVKDWGKRDPKRGAMQGAEIGAGLSMLGVPYAIPVAAVIGAGLGMIKAGKHDDQIKRDAVRDSLMDAGIIDDKYGLKLAGGGTYDIGVDGGPREEYGTHSDTGKPLRPYELDFGPKAPEGQGEIIAMANPLAEILTGGNDKLRSDFTGYFVKGAQSSGDWKENLRAMYANAGMDRDKAIEAINALEKNEGVTSDEANIYRHDVDVLFGAGAPPQTARESEPRRREKPRRKRPGHRADYGGKPIPEGPGDPRYDPSAPIGPGVPSEGYNNLQDTFRELYGDRQTPAEPNPLLENPWYRQ